MAPLCGRVQGDHGVVCWSLSCDFSRLSHSAPLRDRALHRIERAAADFCAVSCVLDCLFFFNFMKIKTKFTP